MPILYSLQHCLWIDEGVALTLTMGVCTTEDPVVWRFYKSRTDRIQLDVSGSRQEMGFIHRVRGKTSLPEMPLPILAKVNDSRVALVSFADRTPERFFVAGHGDQVNMIRH